MIRCAIWYHLYNVRNVRNTHGGVLLLAKLLLVKVTFLYGCFSRFSNCTHYGTKPRKTSQIQGASIYLNNCHVCIRPQRKNKGKNISLFDYNDYNKASNKNIKYGVWDQLRNNESQKQYQMYLLSLWTVTLESFKVSFCIALFKFEYALWSDGYTPANTWNIKNKFSR